jgi:hypothetical protein
VVDAEAGFKFPAGVADPPGIFLVDIAAKIGKGPRDNNFVIVLLLSDPVFLFGIFFTFEQEEGGVIIFFEDFVQDGFDFFGRKVCLAGFFRFFRERDFFFLSDLSTESSSSLSTLYGVKRVKIVLYRFGRSVTGNWRSLAILTSRGTGGDGVCTTWANEAFALWGRGSFGGGMVSMGVGRVGVASVVAGSEPVLVGSLGRMVFSLVVVIFCGSSSGSLSVSGWGGGWFLPFFSCQGLHSSQSRRESSDGGYGLANVPLRHPSEWRSSPASRRLGFHGGRLLKGIPKSPEQPSTGRFLRSRARRRWPKSQDQQRPPSATISIYRAPSGGWRRLGWKSSLPCPSGRPFRGTQ